MNVAKFDENLDEVSLSESFKIVKRDGSIVPFDRAKIQLAIEKALLAAGNNITDSSSITDRVCDRLSGNDPLRSSDSEKIPTVEKCQDIVEEELMRDYPKVSKSYILYRDKHARLREEAKKTLISEEWKLQAKEAMSYFKETYNYLVYLRTYSKWLPELNRRENWLETVTRYMDFMKEVVKDKLTTEEYKEIHEAILHMEVMPSMRMLQFAGDPIRRNNICAFNCAFLAPRRLVDFHDAMLILMCGCGVGFSVEEKFVSELPTIEYQKEGNVETYVIPDSREGWCDSLLRGLECWYSGGDIEFDYSLIRPAGARLLTSGGRASGPAPLKELLEFARFLVLDNQGGKLSTINVHDLMCKIGKIVLVGGVRRCKVKGSRVLTREGSFKNIENIKIGDLVMTNDGWKPVTDVFDQGEQEVIKVKHINGSFECTPNHRVAVLTDAYGNFEWKEAGDLTMEDILGFPMFDEKGEYLSEDMNCINEMPEFSYTRPKKSTTCKDIVIPPLDREISWLIGNFQGDGYVCLTSKSGELCVAVHGDERKQAEFTTKQLERFGVNVRMQEPRENDYCIKIRIKSKQMAKYFHEHVKKPKTPMNVPQFIKDASIDIKAAYLQGLLDADGSVKGSFQLCVTVYEEFAKDIQNLCYSINIMTRINFHKVKEENWQNKWIIKMPNRRDKERFHSLTKEIGYKKIKGFKSMSGCSWPIELFAFENNKAPRTWNMETGLNCNGSIAYDSILKYCNVPFVPIKVIEIIRENKIVPTYDIEVEDNHCFVCEGILTHNSSEVSLSDLYDEKMRNAKTGAFWNTNPDRTMANNSAVYNKKPTDAELLMEWSSLVQSGSGERGIFNRGSLAKHLPKRRILLIGKQVENMGGNPCMEILLLPYEFCNLSTIVMREDDTREILLRKIRIATIIGTYQSMLTDFKNICPEWKYHADLERLLGVSLNGQRDCKALLKDLSILNELREMAISVNEEYADRFGINHSSAITTVKPEGTSSQMLGTASGIHARFAPYYIRRIRITATDPLAKLLINQGVPHHPENGQTINNANTWVFEFPQKSPDGAICADQLSALDQLNYWREVKTRYTEHNPSCTIYVRKNEWITTLHWIQENWDIVGGLSFLPYDDHVYELAPYEKITKEKYESLTKEMPEIDFSKLVLFEKEDTTERKTVFACVGDRCEMV